MRWTAPKIWKGGECWIIGGGPSIPEQFGVPDDVIQDVIAQRSSPSVYSPYMSAIHDRHVIGINAAYLIGDWIDIIFFGDNKFFMTHQVGLTKHPGLKVTCNSKTNSRCRDIHYLLHDRKHPKGISTGPKYVSWNTNSGAAAISMAVYLGVRRIILLGFDMRTNAHGQHWHNAYKGMRPMTKKGKVMSPKRLPFDRHLRGFPLIARDAKKLGIEIVNASPNSAIKEFSKCTVQEALVESMRREKIQYYEKT